MIDDALAPMDPDTIMLPVDNLMEPHSDMTRALAASLELARAKLPPKKVRYMELVFHGMSQKEAAEQVGYKKPPFCRLNDPTSPEHELLLRMRQAYQLHQGPTIAQRKALLWHISLKHEHKTPSASINAVNVLNKMENVYVVDNAPATTVTQNIYNNIPWDQIAEINQIVSEQPKLVSSE